MGHFFPHRLYAYSLSLEILARYIRAASSERYNIIFEPTNRGTHVIETDIIQWETGEVLGTTRTSITVM